MGKRVVIHLPTGKEIKRAVKVEHMGNFAFQIVKNKGREYLLDKNTSGEYILGRLLGKKGK